MKNEPLSIQELRKIDQRNLWHPFTQMQGYADDDPPAPIVAAAEGNWLIDVEGKRYLDANCGYWALALGCRPKKVEEAIAAQLQRFGHSTLLGLTHQPAIELTKKLTELTGHPLNHAFYADSGSEAIEVALKMVYQFHVHNGQPEKSKFVALSEAYHGDTLGAVAVGGVDLFHRVYRPLVFNVLRAPVPMTFRRPKEYTEIKWGEKCAEDMEKIFDANEGEVAGLVIEPLVLGPGGIIPQPDGYLKRVVESARARKIPVIFDEIAVGMGRLGTLFAFQQLGIKPDVICLAKGLTGGLFPLSATVASSEIYDAFLGSFGDRKTFYHGHTFTGSALGCAAALAALDIMADSDGKFLKEVREVKIPALWSMLESLKDHPMVGDVRGKGMMTGIEIVKNKSTAEPFPSSERVGHQVALAARKRGVNTRALEDIMLMCPPLTIELEEIELLQKVVRESLDEVFAKVGG